MEIESIKESMAVALMWGQWVAFLFNVVCMIGWTIVSIQKKEWKNKWFAWMIGGFTPTVLVAVIRFFVL